MLLFSKLNKSFFGCFDPVIYFLIIKIDSFRGDLSDVSTKPATLVASIRIPPRGSYLHAHVDFLVIKGIN